MVSQEVAQSAFWVVPGLKRMHGLTRNHYNNNENRHKTDSLRLPSTSFRISSDSIFHFQRILYCGVRYTLLSKQGLVAMCIGIGMV